MSDNVVSLRWAVEDLRFEGGRPDGPSIVLEETSILVLLMRLPHHRYFNESMRRTMGTVFIKAHPWKDTTGSGPV